jgi:hypothetical protein
MRQSVAVAAFAAALIAGGGLAQANAQPARLGAEFAPPARLIIAVDRSGDAPALTPVQFIFGGREFCWYVDGWQGPGFYWCGYAWRRGYGWGGGEGWHGWHGGGYGRAGGGYRGAGGHGGYGAHGGGHAHGARSARATGHGGGHGGGRGHPGGGGEKKGH